MANETTQPVLSARPRFRGVSHVIFYDPDRASAERNAYVMRSSQREISTASSDEELIAKVRLQIPDLIVTPGTGLTYPAPLPFQLQLARSGLFIPTIPRGADRMELAEHMRLSKTLQNITRDELSHAVLAQWTRHFALKEGELGRLMLYKADAGWGILSVLGGKDPVYFREAQLTPNPGELFRIGKVATTISGGCASELVRLRDLFANGLCA